MIKSIYGVGINDANYSVILHQTIGGKRKIVWRCPYYSRWSNMLQRCYGKNNPSYKDCSVCEEFTVFSNFKAWMETQDWEGKELDKDLLFPGNKVYSPETSVFISKEVNVFILSCKGNRGDLPIGVSFDKQKKKFRSVGKELGKQKWLGYYDSAEKAHEVWRKHKLSLAKLLADAQTDERIAKALIERYENYKEDI